MDAEASVDENADGGVVTAVATENATEVTVDNEHFEVADGNLKLKAGNMLDFESDESPIEVTITATSEGGDATATVSISINDVNEAPTIDVRDGEEVPMHEGVISSLTVPENAMRGDIPPLALIEVMDPDAADADMLTGEAGVAATSVSDDRFAVILDPVDGLWLHLAEGASLDFEEGAEVTVTVTFTDSAGNTASQDVTVTVTDVNEGPDAPVVVNADDLSVDENDPGASISSVEATMDPEGDENITYHVDDDRFEIDDGRVLKLKDGMYLNHESESYVMLEITASDSDGNEGSATMVTVHVNDVNEGPNAVGTIDNITPDAGKEIDVEVDLLALFSDPDEGDAAVRWEDSGAPSWLSFTVEFGEDADGSQTVTGHLRGTPPLTGDESDGVHKVTITASDSDGATGETSFYVITDDGNDIITSINLFHNPDEDGNEAENVDYVFDVDENVSTGYVFGRITVSDQDHAMHPNGMHMVTVDDDRFEIKVDDEGGLWLALKEGEALDHEKEDGFVTVEIQAVDLNGEQNPIARQATLGKYKGNDLTQEVTININDKNDPPKANTIGNWWVTIDNDVDADETTKGSWLTFGLETEGANAAFSDVDAGDTLTYSISGPSWLQIDEDDGTITNKEGMVANRGTYRVTVTATDQGEDRTDTDNADGQSVSASFMIFVAKSDPLDAGDPPNPVDATNTLIEDNDDPDITVTTTGHSYAEGSGDRRIATIRVEDDDQDINGHPFSIASVQIISVANDDDANDVLNATLVDHDSNPATPMRLQTSDFATNGFGYGGAFRLGDPVRSGDTLTYGLYVMDTNPRPGAANDSTSVLNHESVSDIEVEIRVTDGVGATETVTVSVDITDTNEAPVAARQAGLAATATTVEQSEEEKQVLYIKLFDVWEDPDEDHDDDELIYGASTSTSWIKILHGPGKWSEIEDGPDDDAGTEDDVTWDTTNFGAEPANNDVVVIVELDRTGRNNDQGATGSFMLTARDPGLGNQASKTGSTTVRITVDDENLAIGPGAVTLSGGSNPREGGSLRARFNEARDPDLAGSMDSSLVYYTWETHVDEDGTPGPDTAPGAGTTVMVTTSNDPLPLTQAHVGLYVSVTVTYYEIFDGALVDTAAAGTASAVTSNAVANSNDRGTGVFNILIIGSDLTAESSIRDEDYTGGAPDPDQATGDITYFWEESPNGRGGWEKVPETPEDNNNTLTVADGEGKWYRFVTEYDADDAEGGNTERLNSAPIQVSETEAPDTAPTVSGSPNPGGTLIVNAGGGSVQWQEMSRGAWVDIPGATGNLSLGSTHAGKTLRAVVTYESDDNTGVTAKVVATLGGNQAISVGGAPAGDIDPVTVVPNHYIEVNVDMPHAATFEDTTPGQTLSTSHTVNLRSLFQDPDSARLTYTVTSGPGTDQATGSTTFVGVADQGIMVFEPGSGKLTYVSDVTHGHDADPADGGGNMLTVAVQAADDQDTPGTTSANVILRINVAPTGITVTDGANPTITENVRATGDEVIRELDVQDQNLSGNTTTPGHKFGVHEVTVTGDDRFIITNNGNDRVDSDGDGSTWQLRLKKGATFDFETDDMDPATPGTQIVLTLSATDGGGLSTPVSTGPTATGGNGYPRFQVSVTIENDTDDDVPAPNPNDVPGLTDNDTPADPENDLTDGDDTDTDGGSQPPPPGMSLGGIIEDFVDNMDTFEQDLLEDFMLVIDDGIEIA